jgi:hypothetical protein
MKSAKWQVQINGNPIRGGYEIAVVNLATMSPAQQHYGWHNQNSKIILSGDSPSKNPLPEAAAKVLLDAAQTLANQLNAGDSE